MSKSKNSVPANAIKHNTYTGKELTGYLVGLAGQNIIYNIIAGGLQYYWQSIDRKSTRLNSSHWS